MITLYIIFLILYYIAEGTHDGYVCLQINNNTPNNVNLCNKFSLYWHTWSSVQHAILHIFTAWFICTNLLQFFILLNIGVAIRTLLHDAFIMITRFGWYAGLRTYGTYDYKGDWWDGFLLHIKSHGISQYALKLTYLIGAIALLWL